MLSFGPDVLHDLSRSLSLEWLETDGLGGFASATVIGANTRRYHGLLVAALHPPVARQVILSRLEESLQVDAHVYDLSCNVYGDVIHPRGYLHLEEFRLDPWPVWTYVAGDVRLEKSVARVYSSPLTLITYRLLDAPHPVKLTARPLLACRDYHHLQHANVQFDPQLIVENGSARIRHVALGQDLCLTFPQGLFWSDGLWYYNLRYPREEERGLDSREDLYSPGQVAWLLQPGETAVFTAQMGEPFAGDAAAALEAERARREQVQAVFPAKNPVARQLALAADQFIVRRDIDGAEARTVIAGYPWFTDWGRDTMIAFAGLTIVTKRFDDARSILRAFIAALDEGLIPNRFGDVEGETAYNTVDATLWFFVAAKQLHDATRDLDFVRDELWAGMTEAIEWHLKGTKYGIHADTDGLLSAGSPEHQLTWMDAKIGDRVITPRQGKAVEINALWYNALRIMQFFAERIEPAAAKRYADLTKQVKAAFREAFWCGDQGYLADCIDGSRRDLSLRPNQIIALALPYSVVPLECERAVLATVGERLLTPYGLRTLDPADPRYCGHYEGDSVQRDESYHQGTVWPWLLGPYLSAYFTHNGRTEATLGWARGFLEPLLAHLGEAGLGSISEIFDGDTPHAARGCIAQAWSVAELLRVWVELRVNGT